MANKKEVHYSTGRKEINVELSDNDIIKNDDGSMSLMLQGKKLDDFMAANAAINNSVKGSGLDKIRDIPSNPFDAVADGELLNHDQASLNNNYSYGWFDNYSTSTFENFSPYGEKIDIYLAMELFKRDSLTRRIIELMTQFSLGEITLEGSNDKTRKWYESWMRQIKIKKVLGKFFLEYYRSSNVTIIKQMLPYKSTNSFDVLKFKGQAFEINSKINSIKDEQNISHEKASIVELARSRKRIPYKYTIVDPRLVTNNVPNGLEFGQTTYIPDHNMINMIKNKTMSKNHPYKGLDSEFINSVKKTTQNGIVLNEKFASQFCRMKSDYEKYGVPLCATALPHIQMKNKFRDMDLSIVDSVKNKILMVTIGDKDFPAKSKSMKTMSQTLKRKGKVFTILWNHTLKMEWIEPKYTELNQAKYKNVDKDIREAYGITPVLLGDTEGQNYATAYVSMKGFIENLRDGIDSATEFLEDEFAQIAISMGFKTYPRPKIKTTNLTDTINMIKLQQAANQNGILSKQTVCEAMGYDWETEVQKMTKEKVLMDSGVITVASPNTMSKNEESKSVEEKTQTLNKNQTGKPVLKQGLTDEDTKGTMKKKNMSGEKAAANEITEAPSDLVEIFKIRHVGRRLYTKITAKLTELNAEDVYGSTIRLMTAIPRSAFSHLDDKLTVLDKDNIEKLNLLVEDDRVNYLNNLIDNVKKDIGMKHFSKSKIGDIVAESWAIYMTKYGK